MGQRPTKTATPIRMVPNNLLEHGRIVRFAKGRVPRTWLTLQTFVLLEVEFPATEEEYQAYQDALAAKEMHQAAKSDKGSHESAEGRVEEAKVAPVRATKGVKVAGEFVPLDDPTAALVGEEPPHVSLDDLAVALPLTGELEDEAAVRGAWEAASEPLLASTGGGDDAGAASVPHIRCGQVERRIGGGYVRTELYRVEYHHHSRVYLSKISTVPDSAFAIKWELNPMVRTMAQLPTRQGLWFHAGLNNSRHYARRTLRFLRGYNAKPHAAVPWR